MVGCPLTPLDSGALQGSPDACWVGAMVGDASAASGVGDGMGVSVGNGVGLAVSVGGRGVLVGIAACVSATIVNAAAIAVDWMSSALMAGSAVGCWPPQALNIMMTTVNSEKIDKRFICILFSKYQLAIRVAAALGNYTVVIDYYFPTTRRNTKTAEHFEILCSINKCGSGILPDGTGGKVI